MERSLSQGHMEDLLLWYRYNYYCLKKSVVSDADYDAFERAMVKRWSVSIASEVGSDIMVDYPSYIREMRRPDAVERWERDERIKDRWMAAL